MELGFALLFDGFDLVIDNIPVILTRFPGVHLSARSLSAVKSMVLGISPVGMSSGAS